ncbi:MAG: hypothetical protein ACLFPR_07095 [Desulfococcaceae bacterium]
MAFSGIAPASGDCGIPKPLPIQVVSIIGTALYTAAGTAAAESVIRLAAGGPRVDHDDEVKGLDNAIHGELAFEIEF